MLVIMDEKKFFELIEVALEIKKNSINIKSSTENIENWDSLGQLKILMSLDNSTNGKSSKINELASVNNVRDFLVILKKYKILK
tara:strand:+ start:487 stop:738 length:252 start_codon:yes stop_codon:yes gene_type:complete